MPAELSPRQLLAADPVVLLRCLTLAHAPLRAPLAPLRDVQGICAWLGDMAVHRAFSVVPQQSDQSRAILGLWRNALATAIAARHLAVVKGGWDPEQAYLAGLLHDLRAWWAIWLGLEAIPDPGTTEAGARRRHLPSELVQRALRLDLRNEALGQVVQPQDSLLLEAVSLAHSAGFRHPCAGTKLPGGNDAKTLKFVRAEVRRTLTDLGLFTRHGHHSAGAHGPAKPLEQGLAQTMQNLAASHEAKSADSVRTTVIKAAVESLGFDRVFWVHYDRQSGVAWLRNGVDLVPRAHHPLRVQLGTRERAALLGTLAGKPHHLRGSENQLLAALGSSECLVVPFNLGYRTLSLLVLDRTISAQPLGGETELASAGAVGNLAGLLCENLLLRWMRARAVKFSLTDPLTRVYNRGVGIAALEKEIAKARRGGQPLTVLMIDLDNFKRLNDQNGHVVGDLALRRTADVLRKTMRKGDVLCRYGGEEFLAVLPGTTLEDASISATRLFTAVQSEGDRLCLPLTISIGCAQLHADHEENAESILTRADQALYASKAMGRNRFSVDG